MKLQNMVKFPLSGLDMTPHVVKRSQSSWSLPSHWSPWRRPYGLGRDPEDYIYDLYAVCNHHGTMQGGHYTGKCSAMLCPLDPFRKRTVLFSILSVFFSSLMTKGPNPVQKGWLCDIGWGTFMTLRNETMPVGPQMSYCVFLSPFFFFNLVCNVTRLLCLKNALSHHCSCQSLLYMRNICTLPVRTVQVLNSSLHVLAAPRAARGRLSCLVVLVSVHFHSAQKTCIWLCPLLHTSGLHPPVASLLGLHQEESHWWGRPSTNNNVE